MLVIAKYKRWQPLSEVCCVHPAPFVEEGTEVEGVKQTQTELRRDSWFPPTPYKYSESSRREQRFPNKWTWSSLLGILPLCSPLPSFI